MTKLLDQLFAEARKLSESAQDRLAKEMLTWMAETSDHQALQISDEQAAELERRDAVADPSYVSLEELEARLRRHA